SPAWRAPLTTCFSMCPSPCICTQYRHGGLHVDCSSRFLKNVYMPLPENTVSLSFQNNMLTNIHSGRLDKLNHIQTLNLSQNPWSCDCNIAYLKHWMEDNPNVVVTGATCQSPLHCQRMPIIQLTGNEFASCGGRQHVDCQGFFANTVIMMSLMLLIIILVAWAASVSKENAS
uniref:Glycoprotein IX platelet n=1 Tax=Erpetoichthys calabaricus TaxID=27687 RepID=A0A8C4TF56_ERPCA